MLDLYNKLHKKMKDNRQTDDVAFGKKVYREHRACLCRIRNEKRGLPLVLSIR